MVWMCPKKYNGPTNSIACLVVATGLAITSALSAIPNGPDPELSTTDVLFATAMANLALTMGSLSDLAKLNAGVPTYAAEFYYYITILFITIPEAYAAYTRRNGTEIFFRVDVALVVIQFAFTILIISAISGAPGDFCQLTRQGTVYISFALFLFGYSTFVMIFTGLKLNVNLHCNLTEWGAGQVNFTA